LKASELFGVGVRLIGVIGALTGLPSLLGFLQGNWSGALEVVAGLVLVTRADSIVGYCYPERPRALLPDE
jgi:hypothetical protein